MGGRQKRAEEGVSREEGEESWSGESRGGNPDRGFHPPPLAEVFLTRWAFV